MKSILSFSNYHFMPNQLAEYRNSSAGRIGCNFYKHLAQKGNCAYFDGFKGNVPSGLQADLLIGIQGPLFQKICDQNRIAKKILYCGIPTPDDQMLSTCDLVVFVGNKTTKKFFPEKFWPKIQLLNYGIEGDLTPESNQGNGVVYMATETMERKGWHDVVATWNGKNTPVHVLANRHPDIVKRYPTTSNFKFHGWTESGSDRYRNIVKECRISHLPSNCEGQCGALMETMYSGLIPITTLESGLDERVLSVAALVRPGDVLSQVKQADLLQGLSDQAYLERRTEMLQLLLKYQNWDVFHTALATAIAAL